MIKGCGFLILCILGFIGLTLLYYSLRPYFSDQAEKITDNRYVDAYIRDVVALENEYDSTLLRIVPIIEYSLDGNVRVDTAYHLSKTEMKLGYIEELAAFHYKPDTRILLELNDEREGDYKIRKELPVETVFQQLAAEFQTAFLIVGAILMIIFLRGLSKRFAYREPPRSERF